MAEVDISPYEIAHGDAPHGNEYGEWRFGMDFVPITPNAWADPRIIEITGRYNDAIKQTQASAKMKNTKTIYVLP